MDPGFSGGTSGYVAAESMKGDTSHQTSLTPHPGSRIARMSLYRGLGAIAFLLIGVAGIRFIVISTATWELVVGGAMIATGAIPPFLLFRAGARWINAKRRLLSRRCIHCGTPIGRSTSLRCTSCGKDTSFES